MEATFERLTITKPGCKSSVTITPEGIWASQGEVAASVHMQDGRPIVAVMDHRNPGQMGHQLALSVGDDGAPVLQIAQGNDVKTIGYSDLLKAFACLLLFLAWPRTAKADDARSAFARAYVETVTARPPIVFASAPTTKTVVIKKTCPCSSACTCGCNETGICDCASMTAPRTASSPPATMASPGFVLGGTHFPAFARRTPMYTGGFSRMGASVGMPCGPGG